MKLLAIIFITIGLIIILSVFFGWTLTFWRIIEFIVGCAFIFAGFNPTQKENENSLKKFRIFNKNYRFISLIFSLLTGFTFIIDSLNIFNTNFSFWELILIILASALISSGLSKLFFRR